MSGLVRPTSGKTLCQVRAGLDQDRVGFDQVWAVFHHLFGWRRAFSGAGVRQSWGCVRPILGRSVISGSTRREPGSTRFGLGSAKSELDPIDSDDCCRRTRPSLPSLGWIRPMRSANFGLDSTERVSWAPPGWGSDEFRARFRDWVVFDRRADSETRTAVGEFDRVCASRSFGLVRGSGMGLQSEGCECARLHPQPFWLKFLEGTAPFPPPPAMSPAAWPCRGPRSWAEGQRGGLRRGGAAGHQRAERRRQEAAAAASLAELDRLREERASRRATVRLPRAAHARWS